MIFREFRGCSINGVANLATQKKSVDNTKERHTIF